MMEVLLFVMLLAVIAALIFVIYKQNLRNKMFDKQMDILIRAVAHHETFIDGLKTKMKELEVNRRRR